MLWECFRRGKKSFSWNCSKSHSTDIWREGAETKHTAHFSDLKLFFSSTSHLIYHLKSYLEIFDCNMTKHENVQGAHNFYRKRITCMRFSLLFSHYPNSAVDLRLLIRNDCPAEWASPHLPYRHTGVSELVLKRNHFYCPFLIDWPFLSPLSGCMFPNNHWGEWNGSQLQPTIQRLMKGYNRYLRPNFNGNQKTENTFFFFSVFVFADWILTTFLGFVYNRRSCGDWNESGYRQHWCHLWNKYGTPNSFLFFFSNWA